MGHHAVHVAPFALAGPACVNLRGRDPGVYVDDGAVLVAEDGECCMAEREGRVVGYRRRYRLEGTRLHLQKPRDACVVRGSGGG
jgi:hypothetical protein